jgi:hypothetical protein
MHEPFEGAYFASVLSQARKEGRIGKVSADPILPLRAFWDIGGAGAKADAMALDCAMSGAGIRVLDYLEGQVTTPTSYTIAATRKRSAICRMTGLMRTWSQYADSRTTCEMPSSKSR